MTTHGRPEKPKWLKWLRHPRAPPAFIKIDAPTWTDDENQWRQALLSAMRDKDYMLPARDVGPEGKCYVVSWRKIWKTKGHESGPDKFDKAFDHVT